MNNNYEANIWKFYIYQALYGFSLVTPILIIFYLANNVNYFQLGTIEAINLIAVILFEIPSGVFADLVGRKFALSLGLILMGLEYALIGYGANYIAFLIAAFLGGIGGSMLSGAEDSLLYDTLKKIGREKEFKKINGRGIAIFYFSVVIASLIGSLIYVRDNTLGFYLNCLIFTIGGLFVLTMKEVQLGNDKFNLKNQFKHIKDSVKFFFKSKKIVWFTLFSIISGGFISLFHNMLIQPYFQWIGYDVAIFGVLVAGIFLIRSLVSLFSHKVEEKIGEKVSLYLIIISQSLLFIAMAYFNALWLIVLVVLIYSIWSYQEVIMENYLHENMNSKQRATLSSINSFFDSIIKIVAFLLFGYLIDLTSIDISIYVLGVGSLVLGLWLLVKRKD